MADGRFCPDLDAKLRRLTRARHERAVTGGARESDAALEVRSADMGQALRHRLKRRFAPHERGCSGLAS